MEELIVGNNSNENKIIVYDAPIKIAHVKNKAEVKKMKNVFNKNIKEPTFYKRTS